VEDGEALGLVLEVAPVWVGFGDVSANCELVSGCTQE